jgi:type II secretory pathway component GspD/PulD (secretin)
MNVKADISKQDESSASTSSTTNPPPTSERVVYTQVRTKSGTPIVIGGLLQVEKIETRKRLPLLGYIPFLGKLFQDITVSDETTEMVIYIVPFIQRSENIYLNFDKKSEEYYNRYILRKAL